MADIDRRDFLLAALSGLGGLGLAGCADDTGVLGPAAQRAAMLSEPVPAQKICLNVRTRKNIYCLNASSPDVVSYCTAVAVMKARPASDPTSWQAQRAIHWTIGIPPTAIYDQCQHGTAFFLSWHRMYLYWFERIVRAASGDSNFALPYWGYTPTGARNLPAPFRIPADPIANPLYDGSRNFASNNGDPMPASLVDPGLALLELAFYDFQGELEQTPHNVVHTPGVQGNMGSVPTAALDPIFYLHHAMIDRLWSVWLAQGGGRANPTDSAWLNTVWQFYNENGAVVNMTGAQIVNTANQLCYNYGPLSCLAVDVEAEPAQIAALDSAATAVADPIRTRPARPSPFTLAEAQVNVALGGTSVTVSVPIPAATRTALRGFAGARVGNRFSLLLQDVVLAREPVLYYEVYVNLPGDAKGARYTSPYYAGNLTFFDLTMPDAHEMHGRVARRINLLRVFAHQRSRGEWKDEAVQITFVPRGGSENADPAALVPGVQATIGRISLQLR